LSSLVVPSSASECSAIRGWKSRAVPGAESLAVNERRNARMMPVSARRTPNSLLRRLAGLVLTLACVQAPIAAFAAGGAFVVNDFNTDLPDKTPGDGICADVNGKCSLRAAIQEGNARAGATLATPHSITFTVPQVDVVNGDLPPMAAPFIVTGPAFINGKGNASKHGCLTLTDSGTPALGYSNGATGSSITLLSIGNCSGDGISANGHLYFINGNFIGVDPTGLTARPNDGNGISLSASHVYGNVDTSGLNALFTAFPQIPVNGTGVQTFVQNLKTVLVTLQPDTITHNVISANVGDGVYLHSENLGAVFVSDNMIGTDATGNIDMGNGGNGVNLNGNTFGNVIGPNNTISANKGSGIMVADPTVYLPNFIMGNRIGVPTATPTQHIGNANNGIFSDTKPDTNPLNFNPSMTSLIIGPGNFISDNKGAPNSTDPDVLPTGGAGVYVTGASNAVKVTGNTIGMVEIPVGTPLQSNAYGNAADGVIVTVTGNTVSGNVISGNKRHGIVLSTTNNTSTHILGNTIGLYPAFPSDLTLGNGFDGIHNDAASSTLIGGPNAGDFNVIAGNGRNGVKILDGGLPNGWSNMLQRNQIYANAQGNSSALPLALPKGAGVGIDLDHVANASDGPHDEFPSSYANLDQSPAVICTGAGSDPVECAGFSAPMSSNGMTNFDWTLKTHGPATFRVEFYQLDSADDNTASSISFLGEQQITTDSTGNIAGCTNKRCSASLAVNTAGSFVAMNVTDVTPLTATAGNLGDWKNALTCFIGDLGVILSSCPANNTSEFSNVVAMPLSSNANLSNLTISSGTLAPAFSSATLSYTDSVPNAVTSVTVTPTVADASATIKVNNTTVASASASAAIALNVGINNVSVAVTAQDGTTIQTYTIAVNRAGAASNNANLSNLTISSGMLTPAFASGTLGYTDAVANAVTSVTVTPTTADANATIQVNTVAVASGSASAAINLNVGMNNVNVVVTAQDGTTIQTYTIVVNRAGVASNNASLSNLTISSGMLTPVFAMNTLAYTDAVANAVTSVTVTPITADANATIKVNTVTVASGSASAAINLVVGMNNVNVVVTAQDGTTIQTYAIVLNRAGAASNNASLSNLTISSGTLTPAFAMNTLSYTDSVTNAVASVTATPTTADASATVKVNNVAVTSGSASAAITLNVGMNNISVVVTAQDGTTIQSYAIVVNRAGAASNNASLSNLTISSGTLTPSFAGNTLSYTDGVTNAVTSLMVTPTTADANATVKVNGTTVTSGSASAAITLNIGMNNIGVAVTAQDGTTTQNYTIVVNRAGAQSNNANLSNLAISSGTLTPSFASNTLSYTDSVTNAVASVTVTPTTADANATVKVNGTAVTSGSASAAITLNVGMNNVGVVVTAQDGTTTQSYTIVVNRAGAQSNNANLSNLAISSGTLTPAFASNTLSYTDAVANAATSITVTPTTADANATIKVNGTAVTSGSASAAITLNVGVNNVGVVVTAQDGTTTQSYAIVVNRAGAQSNNANLSGLGISSGTLTPSFAANTLSYADNVANAVASVTVTPTTADANATVRVNGATVTSGSASAAITLNVGVNNISVAVTAQDGTTMQTYALAVNRAGAQSNNANLSNLTISSGTLTPAFAGNTLSYADAVANAVSSVTVTPTTADANAAVMVNGTMVTSGSASAAITLNVGMNNVGVVVTAQDGTTTQSYTVAVIRAGAQSNNASLGGLMISGGTLTPAFVSNTLGYTDAVTNAATSVAVTPTTADANATVKVNGTTVTSGSPSAPIGLAVGTNTITIVVTAQDGTTIQTYTIVVTRAAAVLTTFSGTTFTNSGTATANISGGGASCAFGSAALVGAPIAPPPGVTFPDGLFQFTLTNCVGSVTVHATFPTAFAAAEQYYKYGPTPGTPAAHWYALGATNSLTLAGNVATFTIADGGLGDDDLAVNGTIVDQGGPGVTAGGTGVAVAATPTLSQWAQLLMIALLALAGMVAGRRVQNIRKR
jgi:Cadherin-like beta sandwich domain